ASVFVMRVMMMQRAVLMIDALAVHELMQAIMRRFERSPDLLVPDRIRPGGKCVDVGDSAFDLFQYRNGIGLGEDAFAIDQHLHRAGMRRDFTASAVITATHAQGDPGRFRDSEFGAAGCSERAVHAGLLCGKATHDNLDAFNRHFHGFYPPLYLDGSACSWQVKLLPR